jgi:DNA invertase Pin-like site-specific DNA recombinase
MRAALYARVSTLNGQHPEMQLAELREYASRRGWKIMGEYVDEGVSGSKESRPELNRLMADAHRRQFDIVLVWKIDRFGRSPKHLVNALADLDSYGVTFASLKDNLDLSTPSGRLRFQIIGAMAEFDRALIQERVRAGLQNARRNGKQLGRPRRVVDLTSIARMKADGHSLRNIADSLGVGYGTVRMRLAAGERKPPVPGPPPRLKGKGLSLQFP